MRRIDWDKLSPVGISGGRRAARIGIGTLAAALWSCGAISRISRARRYYELYRRPVPSFRDVLGSAPAGFEILWLALAVMLIRNYTYHLRDSRADYTMRRLPRRWEYHIRCWALPSLGLIISALLAAILLALYGWLYGKII